MKRMRTTHSAKYRMGFVNNEVQDYQFMKTLAYGVYGAASPGEVVTIANLIREQGNTRDTWIRLWTEYGENNERVARELVDTGRDRFAKEYFLKAYNYYRTAEFYYYSDRPQEHRALYERSVACFDHGMTLSGYAYQKIEIPYERELTMPGYFFRSAHPESSPTVIITGGGDSFGEEAYFLGGVPKALEHGFNVILFHGPGQRGFLLRHPGNPFRPDFERVVGNVIDFGIDRLRVDPKMIALYGYSLGGYLVCRAAVHEPRIAALIPNAPMMNFHDFIVGGIYGELPRLLKPLVGKALRNNSPFLWDKVVAKRLRRDWVYDATAELYMFWTNGVSSMAEYIKKTEQFSIEDETHKITCPTLVLSAEGEGEEPIAQSRRFYEEIASEKKRWVNLGQAFGADNHCGLSNIHHTSDIVYGWIEEVLRKNR